MEAVFPKALPIGDIHTGSSPGHPAMLYLCHGKLYPRLMCREITLFIITLDGLAFSNQVRSRGIFLCNTIS